MQRNVFLPRRALLGAVLTLLLLGNLAAPQTIPSASPYSPQASELLRRGQELEIERRWAEAFSHYEEAVRQFPEDHGLKRRFDYARLHYDLTRRYDDRSYQQILGQLSLTQALDLYSDVLLKIQAHHVEAPVWKELVERGTNMFEAALSEPAFLRWHSTGADEKTVSAFRYDLRRVLGPRVIQTRTDAREAVASAALFAQSRLGIPPGAVALEYTCGATNSLDLYSTYLTPDQLNDIYAQIEGNFVGLGIELSASEGTLLIVRVISGSPAERSGIRAGDRIISVDGQSTRDLTTDQAASLLQGKAGTVAMLTLVSPGTSPRQVSVRREEVEVPSVDDVKMLDSGRGVGYFKLVCFQKTTCRDLDAALWKLHRAGMRSLIIDLRGNPGGLLIASVEAADKFIEQGTIVSTRGRSIQENFTHSAHRMGTWRVPLIVLIDEDSASAAEIFAGAIRCHRRGTVIGRRSYGKGSVQSIFPLNATNGGLRLTTSKFYSPNGRPYGHVGVVPDVVVEPDALVHKVARPDADSGQLVPVADEDRMLTAALQAARRLLAQR